jgi:K+-sensing histidine kinase KdpD
MLPDFRIRQRDYLLEISRALTQELDLSRLLGRILSISVEMLSGQAGMIALRSEQGKWQVSVSQNLPPAFLRVLEPLLAELPTYQEDAENSELPEINRLLQNITQIASLGSYNGVGLPLVARHQVVGVIFIFRHSPNLFSVEDRSLLRSFALQAAIAVQNAQLYTQVSQNIERLDALLDSAADGIFILSADHVITRGNSALGRILSEDPASIQGKKHEEVIHWQNNPDGLTLDQAETGGWPLTAHANLYVEGDLKRSNQLPPLPVGITYAPLLSSEGTLLNIIATVRDITRFRQAEELKSTFISIISHELKTPIALIKGYVSTLRREDARWDKQVVQDSLEVIEEEADRLTLLIENLLDASRLQAGGITLKHSDVSLPSLAQRLCQKMQTQTTQHTLVVDFPENFPVILADEIRMEQVLSNLIANAIKYAPSGEIRIGGSIHPDSIVICVTDEGPGIAPEDIPHIFDRFYRAPEMARNTKGAGLGLYLARAIIEAHGGRIWVDPVAGKGARICFSLPR